MKLTSRQTLLTGLLCIAIGIFAAHEAKRAHAAKLATPDETTNAGVAGRLYLDCLQSRARWEKPIVLKDKTQVTDMIADADQWCLGWTFLWMKPLVNMYPSQLTPDELKTFNYIRESALINYVDWHLKASR